MPFSLIPSIFRRKRPRLHSPTFDPGDYILFTLLEKLLAYDTVHTKVVIKFVFVNQEAQPLIQDYDGTYTITTSYQFCRAFVDSIHQLCGLKFDPTATKRVEQDFDLNFPTSVSDKVWLEGKFTVKTWPENTGRVYSIVLRKS